VAKWQYLVSRIGTSELQARLDSLGEDGWELVTALPVQTYDYVENGLGELRPVGIQIYDCDCLFKREVARA
jgi:hypothetical protein